MPSAYIKKKKKKKKNQINFATGPGLTHKTAIYNIGLPELQNSGSKFLINHLSRDMTKPTKWLFAQRRLRSAWVSAQSDQGLRCALNG